MKQMRFLKLLAFIYIFIFSYKAFAEDLIEKAEIGKDTNLHMFTKSGKEIVVGKKLLQLGGVELKQVSFEQIKLSNDHLSVGWLEMYPNCCTSYPIPLRLHVYSNQKEYTFTGVELPIWQWDFSSNSQFVAFHQETVHGGLASHFELREIKTNKIIESFDPEVDKDDRPVENQKLPEWAKQLIKK